MKKMNEFMTELTETTTMTKKEYFLTITTCLLGGIVLGILCSPKKYTKIGCGNGSNNSNNEVSSAEKQKGHKNKKSGENQVKEK